MKITIYTTNECQFSKQEIEYLKSHTLQYEQKNLETNRDFLTEMLAVSNNFAGTPVTKIEKDDGQIMVLKGFTLSEFDQALGFAQPAQPTVSTPPAPVVAQAQPATPPMTPPQETQPVPTTTDPRMSDLLSNLQDKVNTMPPQAPPPDPAPTEPTPTTPPAPETPPAPAPGTPMPVSAMPTIPDPQL